MLEKDACITICIALNQNNEIAMETGHGEIFKCMTSLTKPYLQQIPYEPVKGHLISFLGAQAVDPNMGDMFQYIMEAGALCSPHLQYYSDFCSCYVDPKARRFQMQAYKIVVGVPMEFQRMRLALLCWAYKQKVQTGRCCALPPDLGHRFNPDSKGISWLDFLRELEISLVHLKYIMMVHRATVVAEKKARVGWLGEVHSTVVSNLATASTPRAKAEQEEQLKRSRHTWSRASPSSSSHITKSTGPISLGPK